MSVIPMEQKKPDNARWQLICTAADCPMSLEEAALFLGRSPSWLRRSDVPRGDVGGPVFLKSQLLAYVRCRHSHLLEAA